MFGHQTLRDNVALLVDELLQQINARIAAAGREVFTKKAGASLAVLDIKADSHVLETDVHFPTDLNLLWDAGRKCVDKACLDPMRFAQSRRARAFHRRPRTLRQSATEPARTLQPTRRIHRATGKSDAEVCECAVKN